MGLFVTDVGLENKSTAREIKKHVATIHCSNTLSLLQRKISNALLFHAYKELMIQQEHEITIKQLCKLIAYNGHNHAVIKEALRGLLSTVIEWNVVNDTTGNEDWSASSILASVSLQGPHCLYAYSPRMKQLLHSPSMFGKIDLLIQSHFKSSYGLALYENCIRYRGLAYTKWFDIEIFRKLMGVPAGKYSIFRDFKRRVLDKSIEEVNTYSDLIVEPEVLRERRQVIKIRFSLKERAKKTRLGHSTNQEIAGSDASSVDTISMKLIKHYGLKPAQIAELKRQYSIESISEKISLIESSNNYQQGKVKNLAAYFLSALKYDFQPQKSSVLQKTVINMRNESQASINKQLEATVKKIRKSYSLYREEMIDQGIAKLSPGEHTFLMGEFRDYAADAIRTILKLQRKKYNKETVMESPQLKMLLRQFAAQMIPDLKDSLISIEKFIETLTEKNQQAWHEFHLVLSQLEG